jgi:hypothetical protein
MNQKALLYRFGIVSTDAPTSSITICYKGPTLRWHDMEFICFGWPALPINRAREEVDNG